MRGLSLSRGIYALVDDDVYGWLHFWNWSVTSPKKSKFYARRKQFNPLRLKQEFIYLHRIIAGVGDGFYIHFRDGNPLNLQRTNFRITDGRSDEISWNGSHGKSFFIGVEWDRYYGLWRAHLSNLTIGYFVAEIDAAKAYNKKASEVLAERANLNALETVCRKR
jgi:hypothetical protein